MSVIRLMMVAAFGAAIGQAQVAGGVPGGVHGGVPGGVIAGDYSFNFFQRDSDRQSERAYQRGMKALDERAWDKAVTNFGEVPGQGSRADAALYWKAYAFNKLGRRSEALDAIAQLRKSFANSRWLNDAAASSWRSSSPTARLSSRRTRPTTTSRSWR